MNIGELTDAGAVQRAMHEFDGGRDAFLSEHHFGPADQYYVQFNSRLYDAKVSPALRTAASSLTAAPSLTAASAAVRAGTRAGSS